MKVKAFLLSIIFVCVSGFGGCSTTPKNAQETVFAAQGAFDAALSVALAYKKLPACTPENRPACSDPATLELIQHSAAAADAALKAARKAVCTVETLQDGKRVCRSSFEGGVVDKALASMRLAQDSFQAVIEPLKKIIATKKG
jgi:hypothetical protein